VRIAEQHQRINVQVRHLMEIKLRKGSIEHLPAAVFKIEHRATLVPSKLLLICINDAGRDFVDLHQ
jgi:hypothetical protein